MDMSFVWIEVRPVVSNLVLECDTVLDPYRHSDMTARTLALIFAVIILIYIPTYSTQLLAFLSNKIIVCAIHSMWKCGGL